MKNFQHLFKIIPQTILYKMQNTFQGPGLNMLEHGLSVHQWYQWSLNNQNIFSDKSIDILKKIIIPNIQDDRIATYHIFHDIGKPYCLRLENGKNHFDDHAKISCEIFSQYCHDDMILDCIAFDMLFHTSSCEEIQQWCLEQ